ncbi:MAG: M16 family metallopeptidase [Candidatus Krumholzibacteriia bacterium]
MDIFPYPMHVRTMPNGLKVVLVPFDSPGIIAYYSIVRAGSRNEVEAGHSGFAHFFEHMMFRGTEKYSTDEYNLLFKVLGSDANAYTSDDLTCYHSLFGKDGLEKVVEAEADRFRNLKYSVSDFQQESRAVLGEYNKNYSRPISKIYERLRDTAFTKHTYKHTTMGFLKDIEDMPNQFDYSLKFFDRYYRPNNVVLLVVGDIDPDYTYGLIEKYYGGWEAREYNPEIPVEPKQTEHKKAHIDWENETLPYIAVAYHTPQFDPSTKDNAGLDILARLLFGSTSDLHRELVIEEQSVEFLSTYVPDRRDPGLFLIYCRVKEEENVEKVKSRIYETLAAAQSTAVDEKRLADIKSRLRYSFAMGLDTAEGVADELTHFINLTGDPFAVNEIYKRYEEISSKDIITLARRYFTKDNCTEVTLTGAKGQ